jgi:hypothetical protein
LHFCKNAAANIDAMLTLRDRNSGSEFRCSCTPIRRLRHTGSAPLHSISWNATEVESETADAWVRRIEGRFVQASLAPG